MKSGCKRVLGIVLALALIIGTAPIVATAAAAPDVTARSAVAMDFETGEFLFERDPDTLRAPASMTKVMTAYIIYEEIAEGNLTLETMIPVSRNAASVSRSFDWGGRYINAGQQHSVETMLRLIMLPSHNGASVAMAEYISGTEAEFVRRMNDTAYRLGMTARFDNSHGATDNLMTARAMAILLQSFIREFPDILRITSMRSFTFAGGTAPNTNLLLRSGGAFFTPSADGFKTGTTAAAGHCLSATAYRDGRRIITVVMNASGDSGRYGDTIRLFDFGFAEAARIAAERSIRIVLDGEPLELDIDPIMIGDHIMVPVRPVFEAMGATVEWDGVRTITVTTADYDIITIRLRSSAAFVNDTSFDICVSARIVNGRTFVPLRVIYESTGRTAEWNERTRTVYLS